MREENKSNINAFSLANNHINDLGFNGIDETKKILSSMGYSYFGLKSRPFFEKSNYRVIGAATYLNIDIYFDLFSDEDRFGLLPASPKEFFVKIY